MRLQALPRVVAASAFAVAGVFASLSLSGATPAYAVSTTAPHCKVSQIRETLQPVKVAKNATESYKAWVTFTNTGATCNMPVVHIGFEALSGSSVLAHSTTPLNEDVGNNVLRTGQSARAQIAVMRTGGSAFGKGCKPKAANTFEVLPVYHGWPTKSFHLSPTVLVCTSSSDNLGGGWLFKTP